MVVQLNRVFASCSDLLVSNSKVRVILQQCSDVLRDGQVHEGQFLPYEIATSSLQQSFHVFSTTDLVEPLLGRLEKLVPCGEDDIPVELVPILTEEAGEEGSDLGEIVSELLVQRVH